MDERCLECRYWLYPKGFTMKVPDYMSAECRRHAPITGPGQIRLPIWPETAGAQWCGDFSRRLRDSASDGQK